MDPLVNKKREYMKVKINLKLNRTGILDWYRGINETKKG
jgi:hypothetical protein